MRDIVLVGLTGKALSGKNTVADFLTAEYEAQQYSFAAPLKKLATDLFFWDGSKDMLPEQDKGRNLLIQIGNKMRDIRSIWSKAVRLTVAGVNSDNNSRFTSLVTMYNAGPEP